VQHVVGRLERVVEVEGVAQRVGEEGRDHERIVEYSC
jgi:hypothetical protein